MGLLVSVRKTSLAACPAPLQVSCQEEVVLLVKKMSQGISWMQLPGMSKSTAEELQLFLCIAELMAEQLLFSSGSVRQDEVVLPFLTSPASTHVWPDLTLNLSQPVSL